MKTAGPFHAEPNPYRDALHAIIESEQPQRERELAARDLEKARAAGFDDYWEFALWQRLNLKRSRKLRQGAESGEYNSTSSSRLLFTDQHLSAPCDQNVERLARATRDLDPASIRALEATLDILADDGEVLIITQPNLISAVKELLHHNLQSSVAVDTPEASGSAGSSMPAEPAGGEGQ